MENIYTKEEIYTETFERNEEVLLREIEDIKAVLSGRYLSFLSYIQTDETVDFGKLSAFIEELLGYIKERDEQYEIAFTENREAFFQSFFKCSILYCIVACRKSDSVFESILKLAGTVKKKKDSEKTEEKLMEEHQENYKEESIFDILIGDLKEEGDPNNINEIMCSYEVFNGLFEECYEKEYFNSDVRHALNTFLELRKLSKYTRDDISTALHTLDFAKRKLKGL